jgi:SSS family solute:Na+ symporter
MTKPRQDEELKGLVYSLTERPKEEGLRWHQRPAVLGAIVLGLTLVLNIIFF